LIDPGQYIAIEGVIGVGKTALAKILAQKFKAELVLEEADKNPFLPKFYQEKKKYAFQTQIFFLLSRWEQQKKIIQPNLFKQTLIADYLFAKDWIFAHYLLTEEELLLYEKIHTFLTSYIPKPNLVIYLQAKTEVLLRRIRNRGIKYESYISADYLEDLNKIYNQFFFNYTETPLLVINTDEIDFVHQEEDLFDLISQIEKMKTGVKYYVPTHISFKETMK
jgi:deoxyadenosine/deoxycytidine kinase